MENASGKLHPITQLRGKTFAQVSFMRESEVKKKLSRYLLSDIIQSSTRQRAIHDIL